LAGDWIFVLESLKLASFEEAAVRMTRAAILQRKNASDSRRELAPDCVQ